MTNESKTTKKMKTEIAEKIAALPEGQIEPGMYVAGIGSKYVTILNTWDGTRIDKMEIEDFWKQYICDRMYGEDGNKK